MTRVEGAVDDLFGTVGIARVAFLRSLDDAVAAHLGGEGLTLEARPAFRVGRTRAREQRRRDHHGASSGRPTPSPAGSVLVVLFHWSALPWLRSASGRTL